jgi:hypothetical protein
MNSRTIGIIIAAIIIIAGGFYAYRQFSGTPVTAPAATPGAQAPAAPAPAPAPAPAAETPAAPAAGLPEAAMTQLKQGIDTALAGVPGITPEQKTAAATCMTGAVTASVKPEDAAKLATDPAAMQAVMGQVATSMKDCLTKAGVAAPAQ